MTSISTTIGHEGKYGEHFKLKGLIALCMVTERRYTHVYGVLFDAPCLSFLLSRIMDDDKHHETELALHVSAY